MRAAGAQPIDLKKRRHRSAFVTRLTAPSCRLVSSPVTPSAAAAMSPPSRLCLLLLLGSLVLGASHSDPYPELRKILEEISKDVDLKSVNISTHPPFKSVIRSIRACQNREEVKLVEATLRVYTRIAESIQRNATLLKVAPDQERLRRNVGQLTSRLRRLSATLARRHCPNTTNVLHQLTQLQVDDVTFQKRALSQFLEVYNMATVIGSHTLASPTDASP
ncbi:uncharacterized protein LOC133145254 isoform X1 [Syngnathus typhle]|uniref:uncharacterized protein LOC133145254 isoform X1 n=1 Tax=Syngnathus typhle TaxID=161592 RepID=UPI002A6A6F3D|nr:uncharacterized protein LOC133145254 isoform X1 [Syngnathus typhle]